MIDIYVRNKLKGLSPENRYGQKGGLKFLPSFKIQHNKYSKIVKWTLPVPARISLPACTELSRPGLPSLPCSHRSVTSFLHTLFIHYTFFPKLRNYSFRRRLPFYVIFILCLSHSVRFKNSIDDYFTTSNLIFFMKRKVKYI